MKNDSRGFALPIAIALVAVLVGGGAWLFLSTGQTPQSIDALSSEADRLRAQVRAEREKLSDLEERFLSTRPLNFAIRSGYKKLADAIFGKRDLLFGSGGTRNLDLMIKAQSGEIADSINIERAKVVEIMRQWEEYRERALTEDIYAETVLDMLADAVGVESYLEDLAEMIDNLTPSNSGLPQSEIDAYEETVENALNDIGEVIAELETALETAEEGADPTPPGTNPTPTPTTPNNENTVTAEEIQAQQDLIDQLEAEIAALEQQIENIQEQQAQNEIDINYVSSQGNYIPVWKFPAEDPPSRPIIISPGPPSLLTGENSD